MKGKFILRNLDNGKEIELKEFDIPAFRLFYNRTYQDDNLFYPKEFSAKQIIDTTNGEFIFGTPDGCGVLKKDVSHHYEILSYVYEEEKICDCYSMFLTDMDIENEFFKMKMDYFEINQKSLIGSLCSTVGDEFVNRGEAIDVLKSKGYILK